MQMNEQKMLSIPADFELLLYLFLRDGFACVADGVRVKVRRAVKAEVKDLFSFPDSIDKYICQNFRFVRSEELEIDLIAGH